MPSLDNVNHRNGADNISNISTSTFHPKNLGHYLARAIG